jgi:hypothetical protein
MGNVYSQLIKESLNNLDELTTVLTATRLRMTDEERIKAIDRIYASSSEKLRFLRYFNRQATLLSLQRTKAQNENKTLKQLYGINN